MNIFELSDLQKELLCDFRKSCNELKHYMVHLHNLPYTSNLFNFDAYFHENISLFTNKSDKFIKNLCKKIFNLNDKIYKLIDVNNQWYAKLKYYDSDKLCKLSWLNIILESLCLYTHKCKSINLAKKIISKCNVNIFDLDLGIYYNKHKNYETLKENVKKVPFKLSHAKSNNFYKLFLKTIKQ
jgi:hypothetical protein